MSKAYLGDGAYASFDGHGITLTAENGIRATDMVVLEPDALRALLAFALLTRVVSADAVIAIAEASREVRT